MLCFKPPKNGVFHTSLALIHHTGTTPAPHRQGGEIYVDESKSFFTALGDRYAQPEDMEDAEVRRTGKAAYKVRRDGNGRHCWRISALIAHVVLSFVVTPCREASP